ncbi:capsule assembly Wzi family protein [Rheinheimera sp. UJ63]|uniref:capsule assembly Wzi family protein n=1 Tax=Rheinheimera sp. UJ63 TaxID=2910157 RepID=UPI001F4402CE|nr:capsule assembly Wzi family protein [Rheinheimera sp. UJ63]MCF4009269.1 capsule assembly Wzi family protein [Rheinheimera sp. UJ63]
MRLLTTVFIAISSALVSPYLSAAPWIKTDDPYLQQSIQQLANAGFIATPVNTWPIMWQPILQDLARIDVASLTPAQQHAYYRIQSAASFAQNNQIKTVALQGGNEPLGQQGFGTQSQQKALLSVGAELKGGNWTTGIYQQFRHDSFDSNSYSKNDRNFDGSYAAYTAGNWVLIAAMQPQWWGPAIHSSFNFNNQQRPTKSLQVSRLNPNLPLLESTEWLGPVSFNMQLGSFAGTAPLRHANYMATRLGLKPISKLELGFSARRIAPRIEEHDLNQPYSNLLPEDDFSTVGMDVRYHLNAVSAIYAEASQQQGNNSSTGWLLGSHYHLGNQAVLLRFFAEYQRIPAQYNQWLFINPGMDNAALKNEWVVGTHITTPNGQAGYVKLSHSNYVDDISPSQFQRAVTLHAGYQQPLLKGLLFLDYQLQKGTLAADETDFNHKASARWEWRW